MSNFSSFDSYPNRIRVANLNIKSTNTKTGLDSWGNCLPDSIEGESQIGPKTGFAKEGSFFFFRTLTLEKHIETLIVFYEGLMDNMKKDISEKDESLRKKMEGEINDLKDTFGIQFADFKRSVNGKVDEIRKENQLLKVDLKKAKNSTTMVKVFVVLVIVYLLFRV